MAIPSMLSTSAQDEENWRRLERLLCELFLVLRALMLPTGDPTSPTNPTVPGGGGQPPPPPGGGGGGGGSGGGGQGPFPGQFPHMTRPRRRHNAGNNNVSNNTQTSSKHLSTSAQTCSNSSAQTSSKYATSLQTWHELGTELRVIADTLSSRRTHLVQLRRTTSVPCSEATEKPSLSSASSSFLNPGSTLTSSPSLQGATPRSTVTLGVSAMNLLRTAWGD
ncbi:hypothetical protein B566_EDAN007849 [Ephemera danica]|nr:hypothetical protein B566_EDAN007849 [Ephemera danica]